MRQKKAQIGGRRLETRRDRYGRQLKRGDKIRVIGVPKGLHDQDDMETKTIFERSCGRTFRIMSFQGDGVHEDWIKLQAGRVVGEPGYNHSIWIEPGLVELVESSKPSKPRKRSPRS
jgi:hypothetical protein